MMSQWAVGMTIFHTKGEGKNSYLLGGWALASCDFKALDIDIGAGM